jgi:hypothetical protein
VSFLLDRIVPSVDLVRLAMSRCHLDLATYLVHTRGVNYNIEDVILAILESQDTDFWRKAFDVIEIQFKLDNYPNLLDKVLDIIFYTFPASSWEHALGAIGIPITPALFPLILRNKVIQKDIEQRWVWLKGKTTLDLELVRAAVIPLQTIASLEFLKNHEKFILSDVDIENWILDAGLEKVEYIMRKYKREFKVSHQVIKNVFRRVLDYDIENIIDTFLEHGYEFTAEDFLWALSIQKGDIIAEEILRRDFAFFNEDLYLKANELEDDEQRITVIENLRQLGCPGYYVLQKLWSSAPATKR